MVRPQDQDPKILSENRNARLARAFYVVYFQGAHNRNRGDPAHCDFGTAPVFPVLVQELIQEHGPGKNFQVPGPGDGLGPLEIYSPGIRTV